MGCGGCRGWGRQYATSAKLLGLCLAMFFNITLLSSLFLIFGALLLLAHDGRAAHHRLHIGWYLGIGWLSLPMFWLLVRDLRAMCAGHPVAYLQVFWDDRVSTLTTIANPALLMWQKSVMLACILPLVIFFIFLLTKPSFVRTSALNALGFILLAGFIFTFSEHLFFIFLSFELLLLSSLYLLRLTAKS
jgi:hypothetical protein